MPAFYLTERDVATLRELLRTGRAGRTSRRPVPTRRRPQGAGARNCMSVGLVTATVAAASMTDTTITPGITASAVKLMTWDNPADSLSVDGAALAAVNLSKSELRASTTHPLAVVGYRQTVRTGGEDVEGFVVGGLYDLRMLPGFDEAATQVPYHDGGDSDFKLDSEECA